MDSAMDFQSLARKELQALCKKNKIPANMTNVAMADALKALTNVEGIEDMNTSSNECENPIFALKTPGTRTRKTAAVLVETEPENSPQVTRTRRETRAKKQDEEEDKNDVKSAVLTEKESNSCVPLVDLVDTEPKSSKPVTRARRGTRQKKPEEEKDTNDGQSAAMSENEPNSSLQVIDLVETEPESSQKIAPARRGTRQKSAAVTENEPVTRPRRGRQQKEDKDKEQENNDAKDSIQTLMVDTPAVSTRRRRATGTTIRKKIEAEFEEEKYEKEKENLVTGRRCTRRTAQLISDKKTSGIVSKRGGRRSEAIKISPLSEGESDDLPKKLPSEGIKISPSSEGETEDLATKLPSDMHNENTKGLVEVHVNEHSAPTKETEVPVVVNTTADEHSAPIEETEVSVVVSTTADDHSAPIEETEVSDFIKTTADDQVSEESEKEAETVMKDESDKDSNLHVSGDTIVDDENLPSVEESEESVVENSNVDQAMVSEDVSIAADLDVISNESVKKANSSLEDESDEENEESVVENLLDDQKIVCEDISSTVAPEDPTPYETCIENPVVGEAFDAIPSPVVGEASDAIPSPKKTTDTEGNVSISESLDMPLSVVLPAEATSSATDMAPDYSTQEKTYNCHDEKIIADHENLAMDAVVKFSSLEKEFFTDGLDVSFSVVAHAGISSISNVVDPEHTTPEETGNSKGVGLIAADEENMAIGVDTGAVDKSSSPEGKLGDTESDTKGSPSLNWMMELNNNNRGADATSEGENAKDFETEFIAEDDFCVDSSGKILLNLLCDDVAIVPGHSSPDKICRGKSIFEDSKSVQEVQISGETSDSAVRLSVDVVSDDFVSDTSVGGLETESATGETSGSVDVVPEHFENDVSVEGLETESATEDEGLETESATEDESSGETSDFVLCASVYVAPEDFEGDVSVEGVVCSSVDVVPEDFEGDVSVDEFSGEPSAAAVSLEKIITSESTDVSVDVVHGEDENTKDLETEFAIEVEFCGDSSSEIPAKLEAGDLKNIEKVLRSPELVNSVTGQLMVSEKFEAVREDLTESFDYKVTPLKSGQKKGMTPIRSALKVFDDKESNGSNMSLKSFSKLSLAVAGEKENININVVQKKTQEALQNSSLRQLKKMYSKEGNDSNMSMKTCSKLSLVVAEEKENIIINPVQKKTDETLEKTSLRQLKKMFKEKLVLADNHNKNPSVEENLLADKKRPALQALPDNCMVGGGEN